MRIPWASTYHNLCELSIEFALFWHWLREVLKVLHSPWMINAITNFGMVGTRPETTNTTLLSRHFREPMLSIVVNHGFGLTIQALRVTNTTDISGKLVRHFLWMSDQNSNSCDYSEGAQKWLPKGGVGKKQQRQIMNNYKWKFCQLQTRPWFFYS